ncbi:type II toxin-antitoxin system prevent-host-death family antitoxin [Levilactobacillus cerevisiae]|uniref:type II toxin-antitoxin system prevent-host-death family antitoxin n=1 Tax=Levilactobacillus cerevisiae TaxID=1704076 RepID=UPI000F76BAD3|nr:type II toxin-antitoxin system prevent-host-death family antitoxin [Levilactobacillus cerevisiae]
MNRDNKNVKSVTDLHENTHLLDEVTPGNPVILTKENQEKLVVLDIDDFKKYQELAFAAKMMKTADHARQGKKYDWRDVRKELTEP